MRCFLCAVLAGLLWTNVALSQSDGDKPNPVADKAAPIVEIQISLVEWLGADKSGAEAFRGSNEKTAELIASLEKEGQLRVAQRFQLTTLDRRTVTTQRGERRARAHAVTPTAQRPPGTISTVLENVGTLMKVTPTVHSPDAIVLEVSYETSNFTTRKDGIVVAELPEGEKLRIPSIMTLTLETTLRVRDGQSVVVIGAAEQDEDWCS